MPNEEWGVKRICPTTGKRFYDMNKKPIISPYTGETVTLDANTRTRVAVAEKTEAKVEEEQTTEEEEILLDDDDSDEASVDSDLLDDDDENDDVSLEEIKDVPVNDG
ncbi:MAG: TIGR02300 family protein [Paracoccaceae bacterium]